MRVVVKVVGREDVDDVEKHVEEEQEEEEDSPYLGPRITASTESCRYTPFVLQFTSLQNKVKREFCFIQKPLYKIEVYKKYKKYAHI